MSVFDKLKSKLIVSCQAEGDSPFNTSESVLKFAQTALMGGASGIRSQGLEKTKLILDNIDLPVIGLIKDTFEDGSVKITGSFSQVTSLNDIGVDIIAIDGTFREREGLSGPEFIKEVKKRYNCIVMADISCKEDALACFEAGADCVSTTLCGYTPKTKEYYEEGPSFQLLEDLIQVLPKGYPVIAEGRINSPLDAKIAMKLGAWSVVVGSAITRPHLITKKFVDKLQTSFFESHS